MMSQYLYKAEITNIDENHITFKFKNNAYVMGNLRMSYDDFFYFIKKFRIYLSNAEKQKIQKYILKKQYWDIYDA